MSNLVNDPFTTIPAPTTTNDDVAAKYGVIGSMSVTEQPALPRIATTDYVGPAAANQQEIAIEQRLLSMLDRVNRLIAFANTLDVAMLRRDGSTQKDGIPGLRGDISGNTTTGSDGYTLTHLRNASSNGQPLVFGQTGVSLASPTFTGTVTVPTVSYPNASTTIPATPAFVNAAVGAIATAPTTTTVYVSGSGTFTSTGAGQYHVILVGGGGGTTFSYGGAGGGGGGIFIGVLSLAGATGYSYAVGAGATTGTGGSTTFASAVAHGGQASTGLLSGVSGGGGSGRGGYGTGGGAGGTGEPGMGTSGGGPGTDGSGGGGGGYSSGVNYGGGYGGGSGTDGAGGGGGYGGGGGGSNGTGASGIIIITGPL